MDLTHQCIKTKKNLKYVSPNSETDSTSANHKDDKCVEENKYIDFNFNTKQQTNEFMKLIQEGNLANVNIYVNKNSLDLSRLVDDKYRHTPLFYAAVIKNEATAVQVVKYLIENGVKPNYLDILNQSALFYFAREGKLECCNCLIGYGVSLHQKDQYGQTAVFYAAREGHLKIVDKFKELGADLKLIDKSGQTPLFYSAKQGMEEMCKYLVENGVDPLIKDNENYTAIHFAKKHNRKNIVNFLTFLTPVIQVTKIPSKLKVNLIKKRSSKISKIVEKSEIKSEMESHRYALGKIHENNFNFNFNFNFFKFKLEKLDDSEFTEFLNNNIEIKKYFEKKNPSELSKIENMFPKETIQIYDRWEKAAKRIMNIIWKMKGSEIFHHPVDPVLLCIPDYFTMITEPMDFNTIKCKLNNFEYLNPNEFINDVELSFSNCIKYNGLSHEYTKTAEIIRDEFRKQVAKLSLNFY